MTVPLMCFLPESGRIQISGGRSGSYLVSISGKRIKDGSVMMEVEEIVLDHLDINDYYLTIFVLMLSLYLHYNILQSYNQ